MSESRLYYRYEPESGTLKRVLLSKDVKLRSLLLILTVTLPCFACQSVGRGARASYEWAGETMPENPAAIVPYFFGLGVGALGSSPLLLISWPLTELASWGDEHEDYDWARFSPPAGLGSVVGLTLALPFYPFGWPFMDEDSDDDWNDDDWNDNPDDNFDEGPPGGDYHPVPAPWSELKKAHVDDTGLARPPYARRHLEPWEPFRPRLKKPSEKN